MESPPALPIVPVPPPCRLQVTVRKGSDLVGRPVADACLQGRFGLVLVGVKRNRRAREDGRLSDVVLAAGDVLILDSSESCGAKVWLMRNDV